MRDVRNGIAVADVAIGMMQAAANAASFRSSCSAAGETGLARRRSSAPPLVKGDLEIEQNNLEAQMQANQLKAGVEQRKRGVAAAEDRRPAGVAGRRRPGDHGANDHVTIAEQEQAIADAAARPGGGT